MFLLLILPLTAVLVPSASSQALCPKGQLEESNINANILDLINKRRRNLALGKLKDGDTTAHTFPPAKLMNKLTWDCDLEETAKTALGDKCPAKTDPEPTIPGKAGFYYRDNDEEELPVSAVVNKWLDEVKAAGWKDGDTTLVATVNDVKMPAAPEGDKVKNFTNLMLSSTQKIGCAVVSCSAEKRTVVYCLTDQPPLADGDKIYDVDNPATGNPCPGDCAKNVAPYTQCDKEMGLCEPLRETTTAATTTAATTTTGVTTTASYAGELPTGTSSQCTGNVGMTDELRMHFLDTQNYRRSILAKGQVQRPSGNYLPNGANIIKLKLNCNLEKEAIEEVRQCPTAKVPHSKYGKNFATFASSTATSTYRDAIKKAVTNWWKVSRTESNGPGMQVTFRSNHVNQPVETYTQIAWANTKDIGCAVAKCTSSYTVICLYEPKGNIVDQVMYQVGSPCAACPSGTTCDSALGLCVQN